MAYQSLEVLAEKYGTDKLQHGYIPFYVKHLPEKPKRILEIGVKEGRSLAMLAEYFPNTEIHGLDLFAEYSIQQAMQNIYELFAMTNRVQLHQGNQCDHLVLEELRKLDFDVIIDDGSHNSRDQLMTFYGLFNGKHYFIEDLHCCREQFYTQGLPYSATVDRQYDFDYPLHPFMQDREENIILFYDKDIVFNPPVI